MLRQAGCAQGSPAALPHRSAAPLRVCSGAGRGPGTPLSCSFPARRALWRFRGATRSPLSPKKPEIPHPGEPLTAPLVALPRRRGGYPIPGRVSPLPGGAGVPALPCRAARQKPRAGSRASPGRTRTFAGASPRTPCWPWIRRLPALPPAAPLAPPAAPPAPHGGERPAPGRGQGAAGPGLAADDGPAQSPEPRPGPSAATPAQAPGPARPTGLGTHPGHPEPRTAPRHRRRAALALPSHTFTMDRGLVGLAQPLNSIPSCCSRYYRGLKDLCCSWPPNSDPLQRELFFP